MRAAPLGRPVQRLLSTAGYDHDLVTCEVDAQGVALITLNDAPRLNALTVDMGDCLSDTVARLRTDNSIRAAVLTVGFARCTAWLRQGPASAMPPSSGSGAAPLTHCPCALPCA